MREVGRMHARRGLCLLAKHFLLIPGYQGMGGWIGSLCSFGNIARSHGGVCGVNGGRGQELMDVLLFLYFVDGSGMDENNKIARGRQLLCIGGCLRGDWAGYSGGIGVGRRRDGGMDHV